MPPFRVVMCGSMRRTNTDNYSNPVADACQGVIKVDKILYANCNVDVLKINAQNAKAKNGG